MALDKRATRLGVLALVATMLFGLVGARLWFLQTVEQAGLQEEVESLKLQTVPLVPERGRIFDADGRIVADNERVLTVAIEWELLNEGEADRLEIFKRVSGWVGVPVDEMEARYQSRQYSNFLPMPVAEDVDERTAAAIQERVEDLPGVQIIEQARRVYPYAPLASHVVGYLGRITAETEDVYTQRGYQLNERVGKFGVELSMEEDLHGIPGYVTYEIDKSSRIVRTVERVPAVNGKDVQLTIDLDQQQFAEQALESQLKIRRGEVATNPVDEETNRRLDPEQGPVVAFKAPAGAVVVENYDNGQIVALASYPTFDNRWFESDLGDGRFEQLFPVKNPDGSNFDPDRSTLLNRAVSGRYNLGSTFKPFTAYAALSTGLFGPGDTYVDTGTYRMVDSVDQDDCNAGRVRCVFKNATCPRLGEPCVYGTVDTTLALAVSSDAFFYRIGEQIMVQNPENTGLLQEQVRLFGFGEDTGIELPFEFDGTVPDAELKREYAELGVIREEEGRDYYTGDNVQLSIGQGLLSASPLQLATGYSAIANGGSVWKPEIVKAVYEPGVPDAAEPGFADIGLARFAEPPNVDGELIREVPFPEDILTEIRDGLRRVVTGPGTNSDQYHSTTGEKLFANYPDDAIQIAGKTGTAQGANNYSWNDSSAFTGYSIEEDRPFTVTAYLEKSGYGASAAGPVVKCMFMQLSGLVETDPVELSDPLDTTDLIPAPSKQIPDTSCYENVFSGDRVPSD